jgi:peptidoglycan hydrolase-like protein with peptidoglycan-binding domain
MAYSLTWLPDVLLDAKLKVAEVPGWETRGLGDVGPTFGVLCHHTGGRKSGNMPALRTLINGRTNLKGPLAQLGLGRDGTYYVIAAGKAQHAGIGMWMGARHGNLNFIGIEAENTGLRDDPWPTVQVDAYRRGVAAILRHAGLGPERCAGHKEYALPRGRKPDPSLDMVRFRAAVAAIMQGTAPTPVLIPPAEPTPSTALAARSTVRRGSADPIVSVIQAALGLPQTGTFDGLMEAKVREFQFQNGLVPDGIVGPKSWAMLDRRGRAA